MGMPRDSDERKTNNIEKIKQTSLFSKCDFGTYKSDIRNRNSSFLKSFYS